MYGYGRRPAETRLRAPKMDKNKTTSSADAIRLLIRNGVRPPNNLTLAITGACNLACPHCWVDAGATSSTTHVPEWRLLSMIEEFKAMGGKGVRLTGGEPLCHPGWLRIMWFARTIGLNAIALQTNGMLLDGSHAAALREMDFPGLSIQISLDGAQPSTHDLVRGQGAFQKTLEGIRLLVDAGLAERITLFLTEMGHNLEEIPALLELAEGMGIRSVATGALVRCGRAAESSPVVQATRDQYRRLLLRYDGDPMFRERYDRIGKTAALEWHRGDTPRRECCTFAENPYLTPDGRLYPCLMCHTVEYAVLDVHEKGLAVALAEGAPLWSSLLQISKSRFTAIPECRDCPGKNACKGGCMGRAWGSCGDPMAADDRCRLRRSIYESRLRVL